MPKPKTRITRPVVIASKAKSSKSASELSGPASIARIRVSKLWKAMPPGTRGITPGTENDAEGQVDDVPERFVVQRLLSADAMH